MWLACWFVSKTPHQTWVGSMKNTKPKSRPRPHRKLSKDSILKNNQQQKKFKKIPKKGTNTATGSSLTNFQTIRSVILTDTSTSLQSPKNAKHKPSSSPRVVIFRSHYDGTDTTPTLFANQNPHHPIILLLLLLLLLQCSGTPLPSCSLLSTQSDSSTCPVPFTGANPS